MLEGDGVHTMDNKQSKLMSLISEAVNLAEKSGDEALQKVLQKVTAEAEKTEEAATKDPLTGALNRRAYKQAKKDAFGSMERNNRNMGKDIVPNAAVVAMDIDHFKQVNDKYGHKVGDNVLAVFADICRMHIHRPMDALVRMGGEEFMLFLPDTNAENAVKIAEKIRESVENATFEHGDVITCSFGVADRYGQGTFKEATSKADDALYEAKNSGRNKVVLAEPSPRALRPAA